MIKQTNSPLTEGKTRRNTKNQKEQKEQKKPISPPPSKVNLMTEQPSKRRGIMTNTMLHSTGPELTYETTTAVGVPIKTSLSTSDYNIIEELVENAFLKLKSFDKANCSLTTTFDTQHPKLMANLYESRVTKHLASQNIKICKLTTNTHSNGILFWRTHTFNLSVIVSKQ